MCAYLSRVKPRRALTLACQKTNPKGLSLEFVASGSNYARPIVVYMHIRFDLLIISNNADILLSTKPPIKPHDYNAIASVVNTQLRPSTPTAANNPIGVSLLAGQG